MTDTDHDKAIAKAARDAADYYRDNPQLVRPCMLNQIIAAVEAEEKAKEPALLGAEEAYRIYMEAAGGGVASQAAVLTAAHQRAAARADWALESLGQQPWDGRSTFTAARAIVRRALLGKE